MNETSKNWANAAAVCRCCQDRRSAPYPVRAHCHPRVASTQSRPEWHQPQLAQNLRNAATAPRASRLRADLSVNVVRLFEVVMGLFTTPKVARLLLLLCLLVGIGLCWFQQPPPTVEAAVRHAPYVVGGPDVREVRVVTDRRGDKTVLFHPHPPGPELGERHVPAQRGGRA